MRCGVRPGEGLEDQARVPVALVVDAAPDRIESTGTGTEKGIPARTLLAANRRSLTPAGSPSDSCSESLPICYQNATDGSTPHRPSRGRQGRFGASGHGKRPHSDPPRFGSVPVAEK